MEWGHFYTVPGTGTENIGHTNQFDTKLTTLPNGPTRCSLVCPKDIWQFFYPFSLYVIQPLFKPTHYDLVDSFSLSIPQWICLGGISICYAQVTAIPLEGLAIKLQSVVQDKGIRDSKPSDNILPNESLGIHIPDICQWFSFNSLGEIICVNQQISFIPCCLREKANNVQALLSKRPRVEQRIKDSSGLMNVWCKCLSLVTLLHIFLCFFLHIWLPMALSEDPVRQRSAPCVAFTNLFM